MDCATDLTGGGAHTRMLLETAANDSIHATSPATRVAASRRFAALAIQAFQASPPSAAAS